jgi:hypothetical protein
MNKATDRNDLALVRKEDLVVQEMRMKFWCTTSGRTRRTA